MSLSDISDLTDLSSSDDEGNVPLAKRTSKARNGFKEYKITHVLRAPRTAQYTAKSLYDQIIDNAIDLDPEYQRDVVWQEEKQSGLIDSILRNFYIPPIIFAVTIQEDGSELRTCIDGKQRLTSIQRFIDGQIPHKDSFTNEKLWYKSTVTTTRRKLLPQYLRAQFANKQIVCVEYTDLNNDQEREIFQRVQLGVALTPAERLQALVGPWSTVIREIQTHVLGEEGFEGYLDWGHARGRDFQCLATIGYLIENHPKATVPGAKSLEKWLLKTEPVSSQLRLGLHETFRIFVTLARDKKYSASLNRPTRVSPIEFVMIGVLIYLKRQTLSLTQISSAVEKMRKDVRASHQDIRSNTRVTKHLMEFMAKKIKVSELKSDGEGDISASRMVAKTVRPIKRRRPSFSDDPETEPSLNMNPAKSSINSATDEGGKRWKHSSDVTNDLPKVSKAITAQKSDITLTSRPSASTPRKTNNSLSSIIPVPTASLVLGPTIQSSPSQTSLPLISTASSINVHSKSTTLNAAHQNPSLTIQIGSMSKAGSLQTSSLNSPAILSPGDRLAPIRVAKASLASRNGVESSINKSNGKVDSPTAHVSDPPIGPRSVAPSFAVNQIAQLSPQSSLPSTSTHHFPEGSIKGRPIPAKFEEVLRTLRSQYPQLEPRSSRVGDNPPVPGENTEVNGAAKQSMMTSTPGWARPANVPDQLSRTSLPASYHTDVPGKVGLKSNLQPNPFVPALVGQHTLPQRPIVSLTTPRNIMRSEPVGHSRPKSSESTHLESRLGSYSKDRHRPPDDKWTNKHNRDYDYHDRKNRS